MSTAVATANLPALAEQINEAHAQVEVAARGTLQFATQAGELLSQVKAKRPHGTFTQWVKDNCRFCPRTAQRYIQLSKRRADPENKIDTILSLLGGENVHHSSHSENWNTPKEIVESVVSVLGSIDLDPCSNSIEDPNVPAAEHYSKTIGGLSQPWAGRVFANPPYGREIGLWVNRLCQEYEVGNVTELIALLPARTDTQWFARLRNYPLCFLRGRLRFSGHKNSAPFPSVVTYLGPDVDSYVESFGDKGDVFILLCVGSKVTEGAA